MSDVLADLQGLKREAQEAERRRVKREADIDSLESRLRENLALLKSEFGVSGVAEGRAALAEQEELLRNEIATLRAALREEEA